MVYVFAFLSYAHLIPALQSMGHAWLASVGVVSVVFGLAAQNTLGNLIAGISLLLYRPFSLGDHMQVTAPTGVETGVVESLNLGYTVLCTPDNRRIVIPNNAMASQTCVNLSIVDQRMLCVVPFNFGYDADIEKARAILLDLAHQLSKDPTLPECPGVTAFGGGGVTLYIASKSGAYHSPGRQPAQTQPLRSRQKTLQSRRHRTEIIFWSERVVKQICFTFHHSASHLAFGPSWNNRQK